METTIDATQAASPPDGAAAEGSLPESAEDLATLLRLTDRLYRAVQLSETFEAALDAITTALGCERASILLFDNDGAMRFVAWRGLSKAYRTAVDGHAPWTVGQPDPEPIFVEDILRTDEPDWLKQAVRAEGIRALGFFPLVTRGGTIGKFMTYHVAPRAFTPREVELALHIARQVGFALERAVAEEARRRAEGALRETEDRFRIMAENAPVMLWVSNPDGSCLHLNRMLREFWDVSEDGIATFDWRTSLHPDDAGRVGEIMAGVLTTREPAVLEARYRNAAGEYRTVETHARPRQAEDGTFLGLIGVNVDVTERRQHEEQRELLLAELSHRVKNMLAVVQGIARQTFRNADTMPQARETFEGRLRALATAHDLLTRASWTTASLAELARDTLPMREEGPQAEISGPEVALDAKQTLAITLALHELYTNAIKYGALSSEAGRVVLRWSVIGAPQRRLVIDWRETGVQVSPPSREGFGTRLIRQLLAHDLDGTVEIDFAPDGLVCTAEIPLGDRPGTPPAASRRARSPAAPVRRH